jgi:uridine phosphorylase
MSPLGRDIVYPTNMDLELNARIIKAQPHDLGFKILEGNSIAADDFYLSQCRFDGAISPSYDEMHRKKYFEKIKELNILNFEMESTALASFCSRAEIPATMVAVTLVNRIEEDQIILTNDELEKFSLHSQEVILNYLKNC